MSAIYAKISGMHGNISTKDYENWIAIQHLQFDTTRHISTDVGRSARRECSTPNISEVVLCKQLDNSTNNLLQYAWQGKAIDEVEIHLCTTGDSIQPYAKYKFSDVIIAKHENVASAGALPSEILHLNFTKVECTYVGRDAKHTQKAPQITGFDVAQGKLM